MRKIVAFDLEIAKQVPDDATDWKEYWPLGISCGATFLVDAMFETESKLWHGQPDKNGLYPRQMTPEECRELATYLESMAEQGWLVVTWNGLGFDHSLLLAECQDDEYAPRIKRMARQHCDPAFAMFCELGYMIGMDTACKGMGLAGKPEGMDGAMAPRLWAQGPEEQQKVLDYVANDARMEALLYWLISKKGYLRWRSEAGNINRWFIKDHHIPTVEEAMQLPRPDTSWMREHWEREKFTEWLEGQDGSGDEENP